MKKNECRIYSIQKILSLLFISLVVSACPKKDHPLEKVSWELKKTTSGKIVKSSTEPSPSLTFSIEEGRFSGFGGCNQIMGSFALDKKKIKIERIGGTKMNCPDMTTENLVISSLQQVNRYQIKGEKLVLLKDKSEVLVFEAQKE